jgi:hypothetical protein
MADNIGSFKSSVANTAAIFTEATGIGPGSNGIHALTSSNPDSAVYGEHTGDGIGIFGRGGINAGEGVFGQSGTNSSGIYGKNAAGGTGVSGESNSGIGVFGISASGDAGVQGRCDSQFNAGVLGESKFGFGVRGHSDNSEGIFGSSGTGTGIYGVGTELSTSGISGENLLGTGVTGASRNVGIHAYNYEPVGIEITGPPKNHAYLGVRTLAGDFYGDVFIHGHLSKSSGSFVIDHPLDPANKLLSHSLVESPDMKNIYDGVTKLDNKGRATVELPAWFEAANSDFRYQLTSIGASSPDLHISEEINSCRFVIAGGKANSKVSWMVTGIRKDPYALANPLQVEKIKDEKERGHYLHPEIYGKPEETSIRHARYGELDDKKNKILTVLKERGKH